jgi:hypothetical protein
VRRRRLCSFRPTPHPSSWRGLSRACATPPAGLLSVGSGPPCIPDAGAHAPRVQPGWLTGDAGGRPRITRA